MGDGSEQPLLSPKVVLLAIGMLSGGGAVGSFGTSAFTSMASAQEINRAVAESPAVVTLKTELQNIKDDVQDNKALAEKANRNINRVDTNLQVLMRSQGVEPITAAARSESSE